MPRTALKTLSYSLMHLIVAFAVAYGLTGSWRIALGIGLVEPVFQTIAYAIHERMWEKWIPGRSAPVASAHGCAHTLIRIQEYADRHTVGRAPLPA
ncbi:DUF2061 domain-containing protein [Henriciella sp.]|uniref:DUF2061 domain-containing protein n=1 Tax=Henriciella sp. TaxID=1968823 RepID=UPI0026287BAC|nr:DUF2061 domain-containing protein [Henriciella sp.]